MLNTQDLKSLMLNAAKGTVPANFSLEDGQIDMDAAVRDAMKDYAGSVAQFMKNRYDLYQIVTQIIDEIVPNRVLDAVGMFADVQQVPQGQKALFRVNGLGKARAKKFLTQVGLAGVYETFRLDSNTFEVSAHAVGMAGTVDFERLLDGAESMADIMSVITDCMTDAVYLEVVKALKAAADATVRPAANKVQDSEFKADEMMRLISIVRSYGTGAVIFAPPEFIAAMGPDAIVPVGENYQGIYHPQDIDRIHNQGYINIFRGTPVVMMPQSFVDETNTKTWIDPQTAYVFPTGQEKVVKVVLEGQTQIHDWENKDWSLEVHTYKKIGAAVLTHYNWCIYQNTGIDQTMDNPYSNY